MPMSKASRPSESAAEPKMRKPALRYKKGDAVEAPEDPTDIDWEIRDLSPEEHAAQLLADTDAETNDEQAKAGYSASEAAQQPRVIVVSFKKKVPHGVVLWWKGLLKGDATIDVTKIACRGPVKKDTASAWAQAHAQFQENVAKRTPVEL